MALSNYQNSLPLSKVFTGKFCLPTPVGLSGIFSTLPNTISIASITVDGDNDYLAIATTATPHGLQTGQVITISGAATYTSYNGTFSVTVIDAFNFSYGFAGAAGDPTGTIIADLGGCIATGTNTRAGIDFKPNDFIYVAAVDAVRQVKEIHTETKWTFFENFPSNVSGAPVLRAQSGVYNRVDVVNTGGANGVFLENTLIKSAAATPEVKVCLYDMNGLTPVCGDASSTSFTVYLQTRQK